MRRFFHVFFVLTVLAAPFAMGCNSKKTEDETPIQATDDGDTAAPVNNADNP